MSTHEERPIRTLAVIGAGNMGSGIAQKMATSGFPVILVDTDDSKVQRGLSIIEKTLAEGVARKVLRQDQADAARAKIRGTSSFEDLAEADLVVEAVFEDFNVKRDVFRKLTAVCRPDAILGTNTSSFAVSDLAEGLKGPERIIGLHYFYHPAKNRLVEVIPGNASDPNKVRRAWLVQEQIGKTPIYSADASGFIVNRYFVPWLNEAVRLLEEGAADIPTIEAASKKAFGVGMGPFELMHVTGVPIALHAATTLRNAFGPMYTPSTRLAAQVESGKNWPLEGSPDESKAAAVADRLLAVTFLVAGELVSEKVGSIEDTDIGARVGLRWPRGPFELMNRMGVEKAAALVSTFAERWGRKLPHVIAEQAAKKAPFSFEFVQSTIVDGIATLTVARPDAMNALNEEVVGQLRAKFDAAAVNPEVKGIVLAGSGKAFVAGADIRFFVKNIEAKDIDRIWTFTKHGQDLLTAIDQCSKPVVARLHGLSLGGGVELALACDYLIATPNATLAFPETGIGIYPGLGGTQRTTRRVGVGLARWLVLTGQTLGAEEARAIGLLDQVVPHAELDGAVKAAILQGVPAGRNKPVLGTKHAAMEAFFAKNSADSLREGKADTGGDENLAKAMKRVGSKAPVALRLSEKLIDEGSKVSLAEGLAMELAHLHEIFSTKDAYEGLSTLGKKAPVFQGA
ncbi:MAG: enoyl-CoA hydratase/isomerase family protein [Polyangiaceae bacterium]|nr:enoyl-CoA hydratase/isomerase family protein [Polyangiaceae bacterium]